MHRVYALFRQWSDSKISLALMNQDGPLTFEGRSCEALMLIGQDEGAGAILPESCDSTKNVILKEIDLSIP